MRVLIVSEQPKVRIRAGTALQLHADAEVEINEAATSAEARTRVQNEEYDVLVIDGDMSPKGGFSLLYELREDGELEGLPTPPALVMMGRQDDRWLADWAGADAVMLKPVDPFVLAKRVSELAGTRAEPAGRVVDADTVATILESDGDAGLNPRV